MGMTDAQLLRRVELPSRPRHPRRHPPGHRHDIGTATIAAAIGAGGLGVFIFRGLASVDNRTILAGACPPLSSRSAPTPLLGGSNVASSRPDEALRWRAPAPRRRGRVRRRDRVVVGSKNFTEQRILGELLAQTSRPPAFPSSASSISAAPSLCDAALAPDRSTSTSNTPAPRSRPSSSGLPTGSGTRARRVREAYAADGLVWMEPLGFDNTFALVVRPDAGVRTISEAVGPARAWTAAFGYEFQQRADGYPALERTYGLAFRVVRTMDLGRCTARSWTGRPTSPSAVRPTRRSRPSIS